MPLGEVSHFNRGAQAVGFSHVGEERGAIGHGARLAPARLDLVGADFADRGARFNTTSLGNGSRFNGVVPGGRETSTAVLNGSRIENMRAAELISGGRLKVGDPGLFPGAPTMDTDLSLGLCDLELLGSAGILMTEEGREAVRAHFRNVIKTLNPDFVTTPTWNTSPLIFDRIQNNPDLLKDMLPEDMLLEDMTAEFATKRGVQIVRETLDKEGSDATMLLSVRPTSNTMDGVVTLLPEEIERIFEDQCRWLREAAGDRLSKSVLTLETVPTLLEAKIFAKVAEKMKQPYMVTIRPDDEGKMPDGSSYYDVAQAIDGEYLVAGGFNCQTIEVIEKAMELATADEAYALTIYAAPNGAEGFNESINGIATKTAQIQAKNISGLIRLRKRFGTSFIAGCCNSTAKNMVEWQKAFQNFFAPNGTVYERSTAAPLEYLLFGGVRQ